MKLIIIFVLLSFSLFAQEYKLGRGLSLYEANGLELILGGHLSLQAHSDHPDNNNTQNSVSIENVGVMMYGSYTQYFSFLLEYGNEDLYGYQNSDSFSQNPEFRRFYADFHLHDTANIKLGRFLTPIGIYNPTYINALRWSNIRPLVAQEFFPDIITGAQVHGTITSRVEYSVFTQLQDNEAVSVSHLPISEFTGGELRYLFGTNSRFAVNYGQFRSDTFKEICTFGGANALVELGDNEFSTELLYKKGKWRNPNAQVKWWDDFSWYTQYVQNIVEDHYLTFRVGQKIRTSSDVESWNESNGIVGYVYRPNSALSYKLEYRHLERTGLKAYKTDEAYLSFSVLF